MENEEKSQKLKVSDVIVYMQHSMLEYFLSTREEVFFMAVRDRMALSTNSIKEK